MARALRTTKSLSLEKDVIKKVERSKGPRSTSERVNELLKLALEVEQRMSLEAEAQDFFAHDPSDRKQRHAFQQASLRSLTRD